MEANDLCRRMTIGLTAVLNFANDEAWKKKISEEVFSGKKKICLVCSVIRIVSGVCEIRL